MKRLIKNIRFLIGLQQRNCLRVEGKAMSRLGVIENAWLLTDGDRIAAYGRMEDPLPEADDVTDAEGSKREKLLWSLPFS